MARHTRGQWKVVRKRTSTYPAIYSLDDKPIASLSIARGLSPQESYANACLMADSPRMLELLQKLHFAYTNKGEERDREFELETLEEYRQLMAKHGYNPFKYELLNLKGEKIND